MCISRHNDIRYVLILVVTYILAENIEGTNKSASLSSVSLRLFISHHQPLSRQDYILFPFSMYLLHK